MGDSPRLIDVDVKVNYLGLKLKRRSERVSAARERNDRFMPWWQLQCGHPARKSRLLHDNPSVAGERHSSYNRHGKTM
jgi:hypothetical protein